MKIAVAMSGGVDSSVAAALMVEKYGKENVIGVTMKLFCYGDNEVGPKTCCSIDSINDAKRVCDQLGIAHYVLDLEKEFEKDVIENFISEYEKGHTPNPCIRCNQFIKFEYLIKKVRSLNADKLVTGHYVRLKEDRDFHLLKGKDSNKDQSYFLYTLTQDQLKHSEFPIGEFEKTETRKIAEKYKLKTAQKTESQDICFVPSTVESFLEERATFKPGNIVDKNGKVVGEHRGLAFYTVGQRKGLGGGFKEIMYVTGINRDKNEVVIGPEDQLFFETLQVENPHWINDEPKFPFTCKVKIRYQAKEANCVVEKEKEGIRVTFADPQKAITPGQSAVFYLEEEVIGGGTIK